MKSLVSLVRAHAGRLPLADESVHACITSPPYLGLRQYDCAPVVFGGAADCEHEWATATHNPQPHGDDGHDAGLGGGTATQAATRIGAVEHATCWRCGAWRGQLGLEPTPDAYIAHLVDIFREVRRVLRADGLCWVVIGDSYASGPGGQHGVSNKYHAKHSKKYAAQRGRAPVGNHKPKDLLLIPSRLALALQADGWWVRSAPPWVKFNPMPESVTDRPTTAHETVLMLARSERYYYYAEAVREETIDVEYRTKGKIRPTQYDVPMPGGETYRKGASLHLQPGARLARSRRTSDFWRESVRAAIDEARAWADYAERVLADGGMLMDFDGDPLALAVNTHAYSGAHFATFPPALVEPLVKCSTSERGVCPACGAPWRREVERETWREVSGIRDMKKTPFNVIRAGWRHSETAPKHYTLGFQAACSCDMPAVPAVVLDPFCGTGTVGMVAQSLGRRAVLCDLSAPYLDMARQRCEIGKREAWERGMGIATDGDGWHDLPLFAEMERAT